MAKKPRPAASQPVTEQIPALPGGLSALATSHAPIVFFDQVPNSGFYNGIVHITLEAIRFMIVNGAPVNDRMVVAHLRMNLNALAALKNAISNAERIAQQSTKEVGQVVKH
jgi:hypothetical protein